MVFKWLYVELLLITIILGTNCLQFLQLYTSFNFLTILLILHYVSIDGFLGPLAPTGTGTIALDPTFGSFTLSEPVSH
jgi:hypothetical protein